MSVAIKCNRECNAPICPEDPMSLRSGIWYVDEDICKAKKYQTLSWVKKQKAIVKAKGQPGFFFNVKMMNTIVRVPKNIQGCDPDTEWGKGDESWIKARTKK